MVAGRRRLSVIDHESRRRRVGRREREIGHKPRPPCCPIMRPFHRFLAKTLPSPSLLRFSLTVSLYRLHSLCAKQCPERDSARQLRWWCERRRRRRPVGRSRVSGRSEWCREKVWVAAGIPFYSQDLHVFRRRFSLSLPHSSLSHSTDRPARSVRDTRHHEPPSSSRCRCSLRRRVRERGRHQSVAAAGEDWCAAERLECERETS